jgi:diphthamide biosynthesis protein 4
MGENVHCDYYKILECDRTASMEELKKNYQRLALMYHPDKKNSIECESFIILQKAWSVLKNPHARKQYDAELSCHEHSELLLYDTITIKDMEFVANEGVYLYSCRCGGTYVLESTNMMLSKVTIGCDECSFSIEINL